MATALHALGFDLDLGPVADVCSGPSSVMWGRCYGTDPAPVAAAVADVVDGIWPAVRKGFSVTTVLIFEDRRGVREGLARAMSAVLTANRWAVALRGLAAIVFVIVILLMPQPTLASLVLLFAAYLAADGLFAILSGARAAGRGTSASAWPTCFSRRT